jgi:hypothetical protein
MMLLQKFFSQITNIADSIHEVRKKDISFNRVAGKSSFFLGNKLVQAKFLLTPRGIIGQKKVQNHSRGRKKRIDE